MRAAGLFIVPGFGALAAFDINATASVQIFADDFSLSAERLHREPLCVSCGSPLLSPHRSVLATEN